MLHIYTFSLSVYTTITSLNVAINSELLNHTNASTQWNWHTPGFEGVVFVVPPEAIPHASGAPSENTFSTGMGSVPTVPLASQSYT